MPGRLRLSPALGILAAVTAVSFSSIFIKWCQAPAAVIAAYRLWFAVLVLLPWVWRRRTEWARLTRRDWGLLGLAGLGLGIHLWLWTASLFYTSVASSTILLALQPFFVMLGEYWIDGRRQSAASVLSAALAVAGIVLISRGDLAVSGRALYGDLLAVLSTIAVSVYMLAGQSVRRRLSSTSYSAAVFLAATVPLTVIACLQKDAWTGYPPRMWAILWLLALVPTVGGHFLFNWLLRYVSAGMLSVSILGEPVGAILLAYLLLGEAIQPLQALGGALTLTGVGWFLRPTLRAPTPAATHAGADPPPTTT